MKLQSPKTLFWLFITISFSLPGLVCVLYLINGKPLPLALAFALATALLSFSGVPLLLRGLRGFTHELRRACSLLCFGIVVYAIGQLQFPFFEIVHAPFWTDSGAVVLPYFFAIGLIFFAMRRFGKIMELRLVWMSPLWVLLGAIGCAAFVGVLVRGSGDRAALMAIETFLSVVLFASMIVALRIRQVIAPRYRRFLGYLAVSLGALVFTAVHDIVVATLLFGNSWYSDNLGTLPAMISALLFLLADYAFCRINLDVETESAANASPIDVITYMADLVSDPQKIDASLDKLRSITSQLGSGAQLSAAQEAELASIYQVLESYLVEKEPLRRFSREELRERIRIHFQFDSNNLSPFWKVLQD